LSRLLEPYEIKSKVVRIDEHTPRGFEREQFADAWRRYLPLPPEAPENATSATTREASQTEPHKQTDVADVAATGDTEERERIRYQADPEYPDWIDQKCHEQHITTREWLGQRKLHARLAGAAA
jgi:Protein of unknown function (DUF3631)